MRVRSKQILGNQMRQFKARAKVNKINIFTTKWLSLVKTSNIWRYFSVVDGKDLFTIIFTKHKHVAKDRSSKTCLDRDSWWLQLITDHAKHQETLSQTRYQKERDKRHLSKYGTCLSNMPHRKKIIDNINSRWQNLTCSHFLGL